MILHKWAGHNKILSHGPAKETSGEVAKGKIS